jgi:hypothetical protein
VLNGTASIVICDLLSASSPYVIAVVAIAPVATLDAMVAPKNDTDFCIHNGNRPTAGRVLRK